jgi:hypothetical protein
LGTLAVVLLTAGVNAQGKPDFTGKWTREAPAGGAAAGGGGGGGFQCGMTCDIKVTGNDMTVTRTQGEQTVTSKFNLAGEATNAGGRDGSTQIKTTGKWDGNKVVLSTTRDVQGQSVTSTQTLSIEGGKLTVVSNSGMEGATPQTSTYTKG